MIRKKIMNLQIPNILLNLLTDEGGHSIQVSLRGRHDIPNFQIGNGNYETRLTMSVNENEYILMDYRYRRYSSFCGARGVRSRGPARSRSETIAIHQGSMVLIQIATENYPHTAHRCSKISPPGLCHPFYLTFSVISFPPIWTGISAIRRDKYYTQR